MTRFAAGFALGTVAALAWCVGLALMDAGAGQAWDEETQ